MTGQRLTYRLDEVADMLGLNERTVRRYIASGDLPAIKVRRRILVPADQLDAFLAAHTVVRPAL